MSNTIYQKVTDQLNNSRGVVVIGDASIGTVFTILMIRRKRYKNKRATTMTRHVFESLSEKKWGLNVKVSCIETHLVKVNNVGNLFLTWDKDDKWTFVEIIYTIFSLHKWGCKSCRYQRVAQRVSVTPIMLPLLMMLTSWALSLPITVTCWVWPLLVTVTW